jgi:hypothetical protein
MHDRLRFRHSRCLCPRTGASVPRCRRLMHQTNSVRGDGWYSLEAPCFETGPNIPLACFNGSVFWVTWDRRLEAEFPGVIYRTFLPRKVALSKSATIRSEPGAALRSGVFRQLPGWIGKTPSRNKPRLVSTGACSSSNWTTGSSVLARRAVRHLAAPATATRIAIIAA